MLDRVSKALPSIPTIDQLPSREQALLILGQAAAIDRPAARAVKSDIGIPDRFAAADLATWSATTAGQTRVLEVVTRFAANFRRVRQLGSNLVFRGGVGTGKTTLACAALRAVHADAGSVRYARLGSYFRAMREAFGGEGKPASSVAWQFARVDLLVLDEVGVQYGSKAEIVMLTELIDDRYAAKRPTIVVSNLGGAELVDMVGERAADRLAENGVDLLFDWPSFRRRRGGEVAP